MGMDKRDIAFAYCGLYLLAWLIRDAGKERFHAMKGRLAFIHRTLDDEDEATSEPEPAPKWMGLLPNKEEGGDVRETIALLKQAAEKLDDVEDSRSFEHIPGRTAAKFYTARCNIKEAEARLHLLMAEEEEPCDQP